ncbi:DUF433 domain-containing protein [Salinibacter ruber]|uniref:DUF433 domain-containing protein n=1 Tax=Salinibacter ruber TaxID=146919 RepID=UPI002168658E|nr:DUF433 domain-containing protein [Salinibacter ruber]MCS3824323.1 uncharacterized protein (DUF433 family) [Salinibacter ruber]
MESTTMYEYIARREEVLGGEPIIQGTRTPVRAIVEEWRRGTPPEEIPEGMPHLTLAQVFAALAYFSDHRDEINAQIERNRISEAQIGTRVSGEELAQQSRDEDTSS